MTGVEQVGQLPRIDGLLQALGKQPTNVAELVSRLRLHGLQTTPEEVEQELRASGDVIETAEGWVNLVTACEGVVLTHVLTAEERRLEVLAADGDLDLWAMLADEGLELRGGGQVQARWALGPSEVPPGCSTGLAGPEGWLDAFTPGTLLALRVTDGVLVVESLDESAFDPNDLQARANLAEFCRRKATDALSEYVADVDGELDASAWVLLDSVVALFVVEEPDVLRRPLPPLSRLLPGEALQVERGFLALAGVPPLSDEDYFEPEEIEALVDAHALLRRARANADPQVLQHLIQTLDEPVVHEHLVVSVEADPLEPATVDALLAAARDDAERGHALLLAARSAEGRVDYDVAEQYVNEASRLAPACGSVLSEAAGYAAARGDAARADALLRAAGAPPDDPTRQALRPLLRPPEGVVSRNRPCPCGSGRKYKVCCLRNVAHPLPARASLVYARLLLHAQRPPAANTWVRFAERVSRSALPLALDLGLFDSGVAEDYLSRRGHLLPQDERELVEQWIATPLAPYEVEDVQPGGRVGLRPLLGGDPVVLHDRMFSASVGRFDILLARPLFDGEGPVLLSMPTYVHRSSRASLLELFDDGEYDAEAVAAFFGPQPPPKLRNRDGEDLVLCEAVYRVEDAEAGAWERLHEHLAADDDADGDRLVLVGRPGAGNEHVLRGSVTRQGGQWTVETNSAERFEELRGLVLEAAPAAMVVSESTQRADDVMALQDLMDPDDEPADRSERSRFGVSDELGLTPQQEAALLDEYMQSYEKDWVEEPIPALGDRSPREVAGAGGPGLVELEALLDDIEWMQRQNDGGMDAARLRRLLGLPARIGR